MRRKRIFALILIGILSFEICASAAFNGDFVEMQKNILNQQITSNNNLIIEENSFSISEIINMYPNSENKSETNLFINEVILLSQTVQAEKKLAIKNANMYAGGINIKYPFYVTKTTTEEYDALLKGSCLEGYGYCFRRIETEYGVNGLFALSVATLESGLGRSKLAKNKNNFYGIRSRDGWAKFDTIEEGILYFGKLMNKKIYYGKTIAQIAPTYCNVEWGLKMSSFIDMYVSRINRLHLKGGFLYERTI